MKKSRPTLHVKPKAQFTCVNIYIGADGGYCNLNFENLFSEFGRQYKNSNLF